MAITKNQLKSIVKECLIEILAEGMGSTTKQSISEATKKVATSPSFGQSQHRSTPSVSSVMQQTASRTRMEAAKNLKETILKEAGGNSIMADILADTAAKTLPAMIENDRSKVVAAPVGTIERAVAAHSPEQLFGEEAASKWAALAFAEPPNKLR